MTAEIDNELDGKVDTQGLTLRQRKFAEAYVRDGNARRAAIKAGYSFQSAASYGSQLLDNPAIQSCIREAQEDQIARVGVSSERVLAELASISFADIGSVCEWSSSGEVTVKSSHEMSKRTRKAIKSITVTPMKDGGNQIKIEMHDKMKALSTLVKCLGLETAVKVEAEVAGAQLPADASIKDLLELVHAVKR